MLEDMKRLVSRSFVVSALLSLTACDESSICKQLQISRQDSSQFGVIIDASLQKLKKRTPEVNISGKFSQAAEEVFAVVEGDNLLLMEQEFLLQACRIVEQDMTLDTRQKLALLSEIRADAARERREREQVLAERVEKAEQEARNKDRQQRISDCISERIRTASADTRDVQAENGTRANGPGLVPGRNTARGTVCLDIQSGFKLASPVQITRIGCNENRCSIGAVTHISGDNDGIGPERFCATLSSWSESNIGGAGGWVRARIYARVHPYIDPEDLRQECESLVP